MRFTLLLLTLTFVACGGRERGEECDETSDCEDGLVCRHNGIVCVQGPCPNMSCLPPEK